MAKALCLQALSLQAIFQQIAATAASAETYQHHIKISDVDCASLPTEL
jgi:hypothetical protein